jgi:glycyl-tRNA synthetase (class II)
MKNYRHYGDEMEILGNRLDHARRCATNAKSAWAKNYWKQNVEQLLFQWRQLPILHDGNAQMTIIPKWTVDYEFYEINGPIEYVGVTERAYYKLFKHNANLESSWHNHREQRLARAQ